jgi:hypothetical protein
MAEDQEKNMPEVPITRLASAGFKAVSSTAAIVTAVTTIYTSLFSPNTDNLQFLAFTAAILAVFSLGLVLFVLRLTRRVPLTVGEGFTVQFAFSKDERESARTRLIPLGGVLALCAVGLFTTEHVLTPRISDIHLSDTDGEVLVINGSRFGSDVSRVWVQFSGVVGQEQVARKADRNLVEVVVPAKFTKGTISVRRGPRASSPVSFTFPGVIYETAILDLMQPREDPIQRIMAQFEPYPGFPYYSEISDKPTQWPPRVFKDRSDFDKKIRQALSGATASELARWETQTPTKLTILGGSDTDPQLKLNQSYARLRMLLSENGSDYKRIAVMVGPNCARALKSLEDTRKVILSDLPNRVFILRVRNRSPEDAENFNAELKVGGAVYDVTVNEEGEQAHSLQWSPDRINVDLPRLRPGYTTDIRIWYAYLPVSERVFADAADLQWERTQGLIVQNLVISNGQIRRSSVLLTDVHPYHRYPVDPVAGSPTFGPLPEPLPAAGSSESSPKSGSLAAPAGSPSSEAHPSSTPPPTVPVSPMSRVVPPVSSGGQAIVLVIHATKQYEKQNDAREAQIRVTKALDDFSNALEGAVRSANGYWIYRRATPTNTKFNNFSGTYFVTGGVLGILRADQPIQVSSLAGWTELKNSGSIEVGNVPWESAAFKVVLQFFSDTRDSKKDSKRVLTQPMTMDRIFDLQQAKAGHPNHMALEFADLLRFTRERLVARYHVPFTLNDMTEVEKPFYIVSRTGSISENFYLPDSWMAVAEQLVARKLSDAALSAELWALFDNAQNSRELRPEEFTAIFGSSRH